MSAQTAAPAFPQWQPFYANPYDTHIQEQILASVSGTAAQTKQQAANDIARDILRAVDHGSAHNLSTTERTSSQVATAVERNGATNSHVTELTAANLQTAIERNGANNMTTTERINGQLGKAIERTSAMGMSTTERVNSQLASAIERNGATNSHITELTSANLQTAIERNGANNMSTTERVNSQLASAVERNGSANMAAIERTTGEARLTTVIADAASRQAANDSTRDILRTVDRVGLEAVTTSKDAYNGLLSAVERNAGEGRIQTLTSSGILDNSMRDIRYSILSDVNRVGNDLNASGVQNFNALSKAVTDGAWESRSSMATGFQNIAEEHLRSKFEIVKGSDCHYASLLLEQQKLGQFMSSKADGHFASTNLEMQKVKECLASQASQNFAISQLEAQKNREAIQMQLADAKYEALKSQQFLADKICECCCSVKEKIDTVDRDRLRDNLNVSRDRNAIYEGIEFQQLLYNRGPFGGYGGYGPYYGGDRRGGDDHHHGGDHRH